MQNRAAASTRQQCSRHVECDGGGCQQDSHTPSVLRTPTYFEWITVAGGRAASKCCYMKCCYNMSIGNAHKKINKKRSRINYLVEGKKTGHRQCFDSEIAAWQKAQSGCDGQGWMCRLPSSPQSGFSSQLIRIRFLLLEMFLLFNNH